MKLIAILFIAILLIGCANLPGTLGHKFREETIAKYIVEHPDRAKFAEAIKTENVMIGMNEEETYLSWGNPDVRNNTIGASGVRVQWVYRTQYKSNYLYFENGVLTAIQN